MKRVQVHIVQPLDVDLLLHASSEVDQRRFAGAVAGAVRDGDGAGSRSNVENTAAALGLEVREEKTHEVVRAVKIYGDLVDEGLGLLGVELVTVKCQG